MKNHWKKRGSNLYYVTKDHDCRYYIVGNGSGYHVYDGSTDDYIGLAKCALSAIEKVVQQDKTVSYTIS